MQANTVNRPKTIAIVRATDRKTGAIMAVKNKLGKIVMTPPAAYNMVKRYKASPITSRDFEFKVELHKVS